ncbi:hypothetical protein MKS88_002072 [Plasmodium brasilianum]|uniref:Uncharacterized protein n=1 Tax=Plasmodium brasilianum TaxID=5824 RepID=A0ACB9YBE0_PLABR|nr:hypothetical protein MKS88_002072 [Plasmodium brasilianum]
MPILQRSCSLLLLKNGSSYVRKCFNSFSEGIEEILGNSKASNKWRKEIQELKRNTQIKKDDVDINEINYLIRKDKKNKKRKEQLRGELVSCINDDRSVERNVNEEVVEEDEIEKGDNINNSCSNSNNDKEKFNLFHMGNRTMKNVNLDKKKLYELYESINSYDKWDVEKINYTNSKTAETKTIVVEKRFNTSLGSDRDIFHIDNYYDMFEEDGNNGSATNTEVLEDDRDLAKIGGKNQYSKMFPPNDPRVTLEVQNDYYFADEDIYFFNHFNDSNYSQFLETIDCNKNVYFNYLNRKKPIKNLSSRQIVEVLLCHSRGLFHEGEVGILGKTEIDVYEHMGCKKNIGVVHSNHDYPNFRNSYTIFNSVKHEKKDFSRKGGVITPGDRVILERLVDAVYVDAEIVGNKNNSSGVNDGNDRSHYGSADLYRRSCSNRLLYANLLNRIEFISLSFSLKESIFIIAFFYLQNSLPLEVLNKLMQNFLCQLQLLSIEQVLILLKIYGTWKNNYDDFVHALLIYFFNIRITSGSGTGAYVGGTADSHYWSARKAEKESTKARGIAQGIAKETATGIAQGIEEGNANIATRGKEREGHTNNPSRDATMIDITNNIIFLKICLQNNIRINKALIIFYSKRHLPFYKKEDFLLIFQCFYFLTDKKSNSIFREMIKHFPFQLSKEIQEKEKKLTSSINLEKLAKLERSTNSSSLTCLTNIRKILQEPRKIAVLKLNFEELQIVLSSLNNMNSSEFYENVKLCLTNDYYNFNDIFKAEKTLNGLEEYDHECEHERRHEYVHKHMHLHEQLAGERLGKSSCTRDNNSLRHKRLLQVNIHVINFLIFHNIITMISEFVAFPFFRRNDLFDLMKNEKQSNDKIDFNDEEVTFDILIKMNTHRVDENICIKELSSSERYNEIDNSTNGNEAHIDTAYIGSGLVRLSAIDVKDLFICNRDDLNKFLYHYEKIILKKVSLTFLTNCIYFINEYITSFKKILLLDICTKVSEDILFVLSFLYLKFLVIMNSLNGCNKKIMLFHYSKIVPLNYEVIRRKEKLSSYVFLYYNLIKGSKEHNRQLPQNEWKTSDKNLLCNNSYLLSNSIFNTLFLIFQNFFDTIKLNFSTTIFTCNINIMLLTLSLYTYNMIRGRGNYSGGTNSSSATNYLGATNCIGATNYYDSCLNLSPDTLSNNSSDIVARGSIAISKEISATLLGLMDSIISFFSVYKSRYYEGRLSDSEVIHLVRALSYFISALHFYENIDKNGLSKKSSSCIVAGHPNIDSCVGHTSDEGEKNKKKIIEFYHYSLSFFISDLRKICFSDLTEINILEMFEAVSRIYILISLNNISSEEVVLILNQLMWYIVKNEMYISKDNYHFIVNSCINMKHNRAFFIPCQIFDWKAYAQLMQECLEHYIIKKEKEIIKKNSNSSVHE